MKKRPSSRRKLPAKNGPYRIGLAIYACGRPLRCIAATRWGLMICRGDQTAGYAISYSGTAFGTDLVELFIHQLRASALRPGEICLCITDTAWNPAYAAACQAAAKILGADVYQVVFGWNETVPAKALAGVCLNSDLIVYVTSHRLHYHEEIGRALARGARVLCCMEQPHILDRLRASPDVRQLALAGWIC